MIKIFTFMGKLLNLFYSCLRFFIERNPYLLVWILGSYFVQRMERVLHVVSYEKGRVRGFHIIEVERRSEEHGEKISNDL